MRMDQTALRVFAIQSDLFMSSEQPHDVNVVVGGSGKERCVIRNDRTLEMKNKRLE